MEISVSAPAPRKARSYVLAPYHLGLYATGEYLRRCGEPGSLAELNAHLLVYYLESAMRVDALLVMEKYLPQAMIGFASPNVFAQVAATVAGAGVGILPLFLAVRHAELVRILPEFTVRLEFHASISDRPSTRGAAEALLHGLVAEVALRSAELVGPQ